MDKLTKEEFAKYRKKHDWLQFNEMPGPTGRQAHYVTPDGVLVAAVYSLDGKYVHFAPMVPVVAQQPQGLGPFLGRG